MQPPHLEKWLHYTEAHAQATIARMSHPLIGITGYIDRSRPVPYVALKRSYLAAIEKAGGIPVVLGPSATLRPSDILDRLDGVLFSGGGDLAPWYYGEEPRQGLGSYDLERDAWELALFCAAWDRKMPMLGICRGCQLMNAGLGGSLYQDIGREVPESLQHDPQVPPHELGHSIRIARMSLMERLFGAGSLRVNSFHHQAVHTLGQGLVATAWAPDGIIEAFEPEDGRFALGVQFHPEGLFELYPVFLAPFAALVEAAADRR